MEYTPDNKTHYETISKISLVATILLAINLAYALNDYQSHSQQYSDIYVVFSLVCIGIAFAFCIKPDIIDLAKQFMDRRKTIVLLGLGLIVSFWALSSYMNEMAFKQQRNHDETIMYGLYVSASDQYGNIYAGRYGASDHYIVLFDGNGREMASGYVGADGKVNMCAVDGGSLFGHVVSSVSLYIDKRMNWGC